MYTEENRKNTAHRLQKLRTDKGLTPAALAAELKEKYGGNIKVSADSIKTWETTNKESDRFKKGCGMRIDTLCMLADYFNVPVNYLLGDPRYMEQGKLGLSDKAIDALTAVPQNLVYKLPGNTVTIKEHRRRENNGVLVTDTYLIPEPNFWDWQDSIPRLYPKVINDILEKAPDMLSTISTILYADPDLSRRDEVDRFTVEGFEFIPGQPGGKKTINAHLDQLCDTVLYLRQRLQGDRKE